MKMTNVLMVAATLVCVLCLLANVGRAEVATVTEAETGRQFQVRKSFGGIPHLLVGVGAREATAFKINVYGAGLYVGLKQAVPAWQSYLEGRFSKAGLVENGQPNFAKLEKSPAGRHFLVYGRYPKAIEMEFVRAAEANKFVEAYNENWDRLKVDRSKAGEGLTKFMDAVNNGVNVGDRVIIRTVGNTVYVKSPKVNANFKSNHYFVSALWQIYFGNPCYQQSLRDGLMGDLERLHAEATQ